MAIDRPIALGWGRGERLLPLTALERRAIVILTPDFPIATADAYRWLAARESGRRSAVVATHRSGRARELGRRGDHRVERFSARRRRASSRHRGARRRPESSGRARCTSRRIGFERVRRLRPFTGCGGDRTQRGRDGDRHSDQCASCESGARSLAALERVARRIRSLHSQRVNVTAGSAVVAGRSSPVTCVTPAESRKKFRSRSRRGSAIIVAS